ncbi:MAG: hypothetical protein KDE26_02045 [Bacteroidetes bacterium]|nr:hypothetical protein [Bacteroidota bacterium]MCB0842026.1 hypothetical protein [Bacteroidota bacterium]
MKRAPLFFRSLIPVMVFGSMIPLSSCLTLSESYEFKKNGSGSMTYLIDMSELVAILKIAESNESEEKISTQFSFTELGEKIEEIEGVSQVKVLDDPENYKFGVTFKFKGIEPLNQALNSILITNPKDKKHDFFKMEGNTIIRTHLINKNVLTSQLEGSDIPDQNFSLMESMLYKLNFSFPKPVKVVYSSAEAEMVGKKNRKVNIEASFKTLLDDETALNTSIVLK